MRLDSRLLGATVLLATGVCVMHYAGVAGMLMRAQMDYNWGIVVASILIAVAASGTYRLSLVLYCFFFVIPSVALSAAFCGVRCCTDHLFLPATKRNPLFGGVCDGRGGVRYALCKWTTVTLWFRVGLSSHSCLMYVCSDGYGCDVNAL